MSVRHMYSKQAGITCWLRSGGRATGIPTNPNREADPKRTRVALVVCCDGTWKPEQTVQYKEGAAQACAVNSPVGKSNSVAAH